jgi:hypothetical protein
MNIYASTKQLIVIFYLFFCTKILRYLKVMQVAQNLQESESA